jgi:phage gp29-like protein
MALSESLRREIANAETDPRYILFDGIPQMPDDTLRFLLGGDFEKYDLILKDSKAKALLEVRDRNISCREWYVEPASQSRKDKKAADVVKEVLLGFDFDQLCSDLNSNSLLKGNAFIELKWGIDGQTTFIEDAIAKPNSRFRFVLHKGKDNKGNDGEPIGIFKGYQIRVLSQGNFYLGTQVPDKRILCHAYGRRSDNPWGIGLGRVLYWMAVIFKKELWKQRMIFLDRHAQPTALGKAPISAVSDAGQREEFRRAMDRIIAGKSGVLPPEWSFEFLQPSSLGADLFQSAIDSINSEMAMLVLGETLSMELPGAGSRAAAETHAEGSSIYLAKYDSDRLSTGSLRTLAKWITQENVEDAAPPQIWRKFPELNTSEDPNSRISRDAQLNALGYKISADKVKEIYGDGYIDAQAEQECKSKEQEQQNIDSGAFDIGFGEKSNAGADAEYIRQKAIAFQRVMRRSLISNRR